MLPAAFALLVALLPGVSLAEEACEAKAFDWQGFSLGLVSTVAQLALPLAGWFFTRYYARAQDLDRSRELAAKASESADAKFGLRLFQDRSATDNKGNERSVSEGDWRKILNPDQVYVDSLWMRRTRSEIKLFFESLRAAAHLPAAQRAYRPAPAPQPELP